jgi:hypothetical protein
MPYQHRYNESGGNQIFGKMPLKPPFEFDDVRVMVFPLRANISKLNDFCHSYLDLWKDQEMMFRPAAPYVFLMVLHYGKMGSGATSGARNLGWVSQNEVTFTVPLECWRKKKEVHSGREEFVFEDWAGVSPFIYVDDQVSMTTGREVYGWPKTMSKVELNGDQIRFPSEASQVFRLTTHMSPRSVAETASTRGPLVEIETNPSPMSTLFPPNFTDPWAPWNVFSGLASSYLSLIGRTVDDSLAMALRGYQPEANSSGDLLKRGQAIFKYLADASKGAWGSFWWHPLLSGFLAQQDPASMPALNLKNITLKQFLDAQRPHLACYQAIVQSTMGIKRINKIGMLGELSMLQGDISGGYSIRIHNSSLHPIISSLGLQVHGTEKGAGGDEVSILKPMFPYWSEFDLNYGEGKVLMSNSLNITDDENNKDFIFDYMYNSAAGAASKPVTGPIHYPDATLKIYPLRASREKLENFVKDYFDGLENNFTFRLAGSHVYLVVKSVNDEYGAMWSESDQLDWWAEQSVQICVPVRWSPKHIAPSEGDGGSPLALISVYSFSSSNRASIADREVNGKPTTEAWISGVSLDALASAEASLSHCMSMKTEVFRSFDDGVSAIQAPLIEILPTPNPAENRESHPSSPEAVAVADQSKKSDVKTYGSLPPRELTFLTLKQYRDAGDPATACYQALIKHSYSINKFHPQREEKNPVPVQINIHHYPSHPIVESLGLVYKEVKTLRGSDVVYQFNSHTHFHLRVYLEEQLGEVIALASQQQKDFIVKENLKLKNELFKPDEPAIQDSSQNCFSSYKALYEFLANHS